MNRVVLLSIPCLILSLSALATFGSSNHLLLVSKSKDFYPEERTDQYPVLTDPVSGVECRIMANGEWGGNMPNLGGMAIQLAFPCLDKNTCSNVGEKYDPGILAFSGSIRTTGGIFGMIEATQFIPSLLYAK